MKPTVLMGIALRSVCGSAGKTLMIAFQKYTTVDKSCIERLSMGSRIVQAAGQGSLFGRYPCAGCMYSRHRRRKIRVGTTHHLLLNGQVVSPCPRIRSSQNHSYVYMYSTSPMKSEIGLSVLTPAPLVCKNGGCTVTLRAWD